MSGGRLSGCARPTVIYGWLGAVQDRRLEERSQCSRCSWVVDSSKAVYSTRRLRSWHAGRYIVCIIGTHSGPDISRWTTSFSNLWR